MYTLFQTMGDGLDGVHVDHRDGDRPRVLFVTCHAVRHRRLTCAFVGNSC
jgi:hypothetical protein